MSARMEQTYDIDTAVVSVEQVVKGSKMPFEVALTGGQDKYTGQVIVPDNFYDWGKSIGPKAQALMGQQTVSARVKVTFVPKNDGSGFFENKTLLDIAPLGGLPPMAMPVAGGTPAMPVQPQMPAQVVQPQQPVQAPQPQMAPQAPQTAPNAVGDMMAANEAKEAIRTRQGIVKNAVEYVSAQATAGMFEGSTDCDQALKARIEDLARYTMMGSFQADGQNKAAEVTPQSIAAGVEDVQVGVPFDTSEQQEAT